MADVNVRCIVRLNFISSIGTKSVQEKESIISVRYGQTNLSLGSLFWHHSADPRDAKTGNLGTDLSVCMYLIIMSDSCSIPVVSVFKIQSH